MPKTTLINNRRYLGNKYRLLPFITQVVNDHCPNVQIVANLFAGTGAVSSAFQDRTIITNEEKAKKDEGLKKVIQEMTEKEAKLPGTIPSVNAMIVEFLKQKMSEGIIFVSLGEIYAYLDERIKDSIFAGRYKLDTFHNTIRGELNKHHDESTYSTSLGIYKRGEKGMYTLTTKGENYFGR